MGWWVVVKKEMGFEGKGVYGMIGMIVGGVVKMGVEGLLILVFEMGIGGGGWWRLMSEVWRLRMVVLMEGKGEKMGMD